MSYEPNFPDLYRHAADLVDKILRGAVERLMGTKAEARFAFIQEHAEFASEEMLDV